jgi:predicted acetyltransferase
MIKMVCRAATKADEQAIKKIRRYAFESNRNTYEEPKEPEKEPLIIYPFKDYIYVQNDEITAVIGIINFKQRIRGTWVNMAGVTGVACKPEFRRQNHITKLFEFVFQTIHSEGYIVSALYPFLYSYYEKVGYCYADSVVIYKLRSKNIKQKKTPNRVIKEVYDEDYIQCQKIYQRMSEKQDGLVNRPPSIWKKLLGWNWSSGGFQFICQDEEGKNTGYAIIRFQKRTHWEKESFIEVRELVTEDSATKQAFLTFLANHDSQRKYIKIAPYDSNYRLYLKEPSIKEKKEIGNSMFRIINVNKLLSTIQYLNTPNAEIIIKIIDPVTQCPWNSHTFLLSVKEGQGQIALTKKDPEIELSIKSLSQIVFGTYSPIELADVEEITGSKETLEKLTAIFPKQYATLRDYF